MKAIIEPAKEIPVIEEVDVCVVGGGCTGVFAAIRAARLGMRVTLIETLGHFGGAATARMVNVWHSIWNTTGEMQIAAGLTEEVLIKLRKVNGLVERDKADQNAPYTFNAAVLSVFLDQMLIEAGVNARLHTRVVSADVDGDQVRAVIIEDKSGRRAITAKQFIDCTGDADLVFQAAGEDACARHQNLQPPTTAMIMDGDQNLRKHAGESGKVYFTQIVYDEKNPYHLEPGFLWSGPVPGSPDLRQVFGTRVHGVDCSIAEDLTRAELEGRQQAWKIINALNHHYGENTVNMVALPACTGIRDSRHARCVHQLTEMEVLEGQSFDDGIAFGTYRVDIHHQGGAGLTFRYLDGREEISHGESPGQKGRVKQRWREARDVDPTYYQVPFRSLRVAALSNVTVAGRCIDTDMGAFGAIRVMVNCNQMGEACGVAAALSINSDTPLEGLAASTLRQTLVAGGSIIPD